ncbi:hypothetical protein [Micromonospora inositola]|uniref:Flp pilus-assembly TadE/G-like n=1 Tax=Micromonospora inositola TaxID=47865 RepID=A0A1C5IU80_9ACTN|nr:hypothetical protein [Micromonospora inositola]SCG61918.1 hypothetical protein GA0070613_3464 [Micromonospora inositola]
MPKRQGTGQPRTGPVTDNPGVRYGGRTSARLRRRLLATAVVAALAAAGVLVAVPLLRDRSQHRLDQRADREVTTTAQRTRAALLATPSASGPALRDAADAVDGVEVLTVEDADPGVRLVFRVRVAKTAASVFGWQRANVGACFAQLVRPAAAPAPMERLPCPD